VADYRHEEWGVDVAVSGSQKGLMLPPGVSFNAVSEKAIAASASARLPRAYWDWADVIEFNRQGFFPYTPATNLLHGLKVALDMLEEEGLDNVFARHRRAASATRAAAEHWGLELQCADSNAHSPGLTAVRVPEGVSADALRAEILGASNLSLGGGLGQLADRVFRIGHMGRFQRLRHVRHHCLRRGRHANAGRASQAWRRPVGPRHGSTCRPARSERLIVERLWLKGADETAVAPLAWCSIEIPVSCEQGICGTCITRVIEGEPDHRDMLLIDTDDESPPCCSRPRSPMLVIDL
jgi:hypothetical protein